MQVVAKPESTPKASNMIMQTSTTAPSTTMNLEKGNPSQGSSSSNNPHHLKIFQPMLALYGPEQGQCWETYLN